MFKGLIETGAKTPVSDDVKSCEFGPSRYPACRSICQKAVFLGCFVEVCQAIRRGCRFLQKGDAIQTAYFVSKNKYPEDSSAQQGLIE
ncbi:MAG: hypothetical protein P8J33_05085 [Pirellulaceae bacterium]|nr:hypothetical protein [Pirellulaceae bacterium]